MLGPSLRARVRFGEAGKAHMEERGIWGSRNGGRCGGSQQ